MILAATDADCGVDRTYCTIDGGALREFSGPFVISAVGSHNVEYYSSDGVGHGESIRSTSFTLKCG